MLKYRPFEMHCHTRHSDGTFLVPQLIESVAAYGYAGLALTDHNAVTGLLEVTEELQRKNNCLVLPGIESVSYTHLDVYKRQHWKWMYILRMTAFTSAMIHPMAHILI